MIIMTKEQKIKDILLKLELELKDRDMWGGDERRPHESALNSKEPFCIDTLEFHQWLEYILIKKMHQIIDDKLELPGNVQKSILWLLSTTEVSGVNTEALLTYYDSLMKFLPKRH